MDYLRKNDGVLSVSQLNDYLKMLMDGDRLLANVYLRGEISNFKYYASSPAPQIPEGPKNTFAPEQDQPLTFSPCHFLNPFQRNTGNGKAAA